MPQMVTPGDDKRSESDVAAKASDWVERFARFGFATKGTVYLIIGGVAAWAALWEGVETEGQRGAIEEIGRQPFGRVLLGVAALGLGCYAVWRFLQAIFDTDREGRGWRGGIVRLGYAVSGLVYLILMSTAATIVFDVAGFVGDEPEEEWTRWLLGLPLGPWIVGGVGAVVIGVGIEHFHRAYRFRFMRKYDRRELPHGARRPLLRIGQFGFAARGVTFCIIGGFLVLAAVQFDPSRVKDLGEALEVIAAQPYGPALLGLVAAGFLAYGVYCFSHAWCGRFEADEVFEE